MTPSAADVEAGQAVYTPATLRSYDWFVLGLSNRLIWRCSTPRLLAMYNRHVTSNHLDVGVGTGYFLDRCRFPNDRPRIGLLDMNTDCLAAAARRISRYQPTVLRANILAPLEIDEQPFDSIGMNYLLHCLPGTLPEKAAAFDHATHLLRPGGILFGATLLADGVRKNWAARRLMDLYNRRQIFSNRDDSLEQLDAALAQRFTTHAIEVVGCAALFSGRRASQ